MLHGLPLAKLQLLKSLWGALIPFVIIVCRFGLDPLRSISINIECSMRQLLEHGAQHALLLCLFQDAGLCCNANSARITTCLLRMVAMQLGNLARLESLWLENDVPLALKATFMQILTLATSLSPPSAPVQFGNHTMHCFFARYGKWVTCSKNERLPISTTCKMSSCLEMVVLSWQLEAVSMLHRASWHFYGDARNYLHLPCS
eukprot:4632556-Amphidinium_carterae.2